MANSKISVHGIGDELNGFFETSNTKSGMSHAYLGILQTHIPMKPAIQGVKQHIFCLTTRELSSSLSQVFAIDITSVRLELLGSRGFVIMFTRPSIHWPANLSKEKEQTKCFPGTSTEHGGIRHTPGIPPFGSREQPRGTC